MRSHRTDGVSIVFGLLFLAIAGWWVVRRFVTFDVPNLGWIVAAGLITLGVIGVVGSLAGRAREEPEPPADDRVDTLQFDVPESPQDHERSERSQGTWVEDDPTR